MLHCRVRSLHCTALCVTTSSMAHSDGSNASVLTLVFRICRTIILSSPTVDPKTMAPGVSPSLNPGDDVQFKDLVILARERSLNDVNPPDFNDTQ